MRNRTRKCWEERCMEPTRVEGAWLCTTHKKERRRKTTHKYWKSNQRALAKDVKLWRTSTPKGFLCFVYSNMRNRVKGVTGHPRPEIWRGKPLLSKDDFYSWALNDAAFKGLFSVWLDNGRLRSTLPSIDRINGSGGYTIGNMRWVTFEENCRSNVGSEPIGRNPQ